MIPLWLLGACAAPDAPPSAPLSASVRRPALTSATTPETGDTATSTPPTRTPSSCAGPPYPTQFDMIGEGWGWADGACWIDPDWPRQPCPEVHLGPPPGPGGDACQTRSDCPADGVDGTWFCGAGACRRFEEEWLTLCVHEAWIAGALSQFGEPIPPGTSVTPSFSGAVNYFGEITDESYGSGTPYSVRKYPLQTGVRIPYTEACRTTVQRCDLIPPMADHPPNDGVDSAVFLKLQWLTWKTAPSPDTCTLPTERNGPRNYATLHFRDLADQINSGCTSLSAPPYGYADFKEELCVYEQGATVSLWYP